MSTTTVLFWLFFGMILGVKAVTLKEVEEKITNLYKLEETVEWLVKEFYSLKQSKSNFSSDCQCAELQGRLDNVTDKTDQLDQRVTNSETAINRLQNVLEYGRRESIRTYPYNSKYSIVVSYSYVY